MTAATDMTATHSPTISKSLFPSSGSDLANGDWLLAFAQRIDLFIFYTLSLLKGFICSYFVPCLCSKGSSVHIVYLAFAQRVHLFILCTLPLLKGFICSYFVPCLCSKGSSVHNLYLAFTERVHLSIIFTLLLLKGFICFNFLPCLC